jgi:hypothetical protein
MYAPSLAFAALPKSVHFRWIAMSGCGLLAVAGVLFAVSGNPLGFSASATLLGIGWSMVTLGTTLWVHEAGQPSRWLLGLHDAALLGAALLGALAAGAFS